MTPEDRQLISGLFERMKEFGSPEKDGEAEALIRQSVQQNPDAAYMLVQSVLVQEHALQQADARIRALEEQMEQMEAQQQQRPAGGGGFLDSLFGGVRAAPSPRPAPVNRAAVGSVPSAGGRSGPMGAPAMRAGADTQQGGPGARPGPAGGGSFMQSAMATAAGVAGGMLLANGISSMLGGGSAQAAQTPAATDTAQAQPASHEDNAADHDNNLHDASHDDDWGGGDDWGGDDFDI